MSTGVTDFTRDDEWDRRLEVDRQNDEYEASLLADELREIDEACAAVDTLQSNAAVPAPTPTVADLETDTTDESPPTQTLDELRRLRLAYFAPPPQSKPSKSVSSRLRRQVPATASRMQLRPRQLKKS